MTGADLVREARTRGVTLRVEGGMVRACGPEEALTDDLVSELRAHKAEVVAVLQERQADHMARTVRQTMQAGAVPIWPVPWNKVLHCEECGPVYWGAPGTVKMCPWCWLGAGG